jgi:regulator of replication initiation timing
MKNALNVIKYYLEDLYLVIRHYVVNIAHALAGKVEKNYRTIRRELGTDILDLIEENRELRTQVDKLVKKAGKKTAAVAKSPVKKAAPAKKKTSGK